MYIVYALFDYLIGILAAGEYLAKLTTTIGISDSMTAILASVMTLSGVFQMFSIFLAHKTPVKRWVAPTIFLTSVLYSMLYLIPLVGVRGNVSVLFLTIIVLANALKNVAAPVLSNWFFSLVPSRERGMFSSKSLIISVIGGTVFTLAVGALIDRMDKLGRTEDTFKIIIALILVLMVGQILPLIIAKEKPLNVEKKEGVFTPVRSLIKNRSYRTAIIVFAVYGFAAGLTTPFLSTYQISELGFSMSTIALMNTVVNAIWMLALAFFGRYSLKHSKKSIISLSYVFAIIAFILLIISSPGIAIITFPAYRAVSCMYSAANCISATNYLFEITPPEERTAAISLSTLCSGLAGFGATLIASGIFDFIQKNGFSLFGIKLYAQQVMAIISLMIITVIALVWFIFTRRHPEKPEFIDL